MDIPGYNIIRKVGHGATAYVYVATQESLERQVALKILTPALAADPEYSKRFLKEGRIIAKLPSHPHLVTIHDVGFHNDQYYMAMEYLSSGTLSDITKRGLSLRETLGIIEQVAAALAHIHKHHVIHRDIKPGNIMFRDDHTAVLTDFGIAKQTDTTADATALGTTIGTPYYMSPEQIEGKSPTVCSDLYSLGIAFFEMLTGKKPYDGENVFAILWKHQQEPIPLLPPEYAHIQPTLEKLLAKAPDDRFQSANELIQAIKVLLANTDDETLNIALEDLFRWEQTTKTKIEIPRPQRTLTKLMSGIVALGLVGFSGYYFGVDNPWRTSSTPPAVDPPFYLDDQILTPSSTPNPQLSVANQEKVTRLLEAGQVHFELGRFVEPVGANAYDAFRRVLDVDPFNKIAKSGVDNIAQHYTKRAKELLREGKTSSGLALIETGLRISPENDDLLTLLTELNAHHIK